MLRSQVALLPARLFVGHADLRLILYCGVIILRSHQHLIPVFTEKHFSRLRNIDDGIGILCRHRIGIIIGMDELDISSRSRISRINEAGPCLCDTIFINIADAGAHTRSAAVAGTAVICQPETVYLYRGDRLLIRSHICIREVLGI